MYLHTYICIFVSHIPCISSFDMVCGSLRFNNLLHTHTHTHSYEMRDADNAIYVNTHCWAPLLVMTVLPAALFSCAQKFHFIFLLCQNPP